MAMMGERTQIRLSEVVRREVLDLEGFVVVEEDDPGPFLSFIFRGQIETFIRTKNLPPTLLKAVVDATTRAPTSWRFDASRVGVRVFGEAPDRTVHNCLGPTNVFRAGVRDWAILVFNGRSELVVRSGALPTFLRRKVQDSF